MEQEVVRTVRIVIDSSGAKSGGADVESALKSIDDKVDGLTASIGDKFASVKNTLLGLFSFEAIKGQIDSLIQSFDRLASKSATLGVSTEWMQAFQYAAAS